MDTITETNLHAARQILGGFYTNTESFTEDVEASAEMLYIIGHLISGWGFDGKVVSTVLRGVIEEYLPEDDPVRQQLL